MIRFLFALLLLPTLAHAQDGLLPVEQAYVLKAELAGPDRIALHWTIAKDYYLYKGRIKAKTSQPGLTLGALDLPKGIEEHDEFFGDVEIYHDSIEANLPFTLTDASAASIDFTITVQGCHETEPKICYPPHPVKLSLKREAIAAAAPLSPLAAKLGGGSILGSPMDTLDADETLPPEKAFVFEAIELSPTEILARWTMPKGYYLYRDRSQLSVVGGQDVEVGAPQWPAGVDHTASMNLLRRPNLSCRRRSRCLIPSPPMPRQTMPCAHNRRHPAALACSARCCLPSSAASC